MILGMTFSLLEYWATFSWFPLSPFTVISLEVIGVIFLFILLVVIWQLRRILPIHGVMEFADRVGVVVQSLQPRGLVKVNGEIWRARSVDRQAIAAGSEDRIVKKEGMNLLVEPVQDPD